MATGAAANASTHRIAFLSVTVPTATMAFVTIAQWLTSQGMLHVLQSKLGVQHADVRNSADQNLPAVDCHQQCDLLRRNISCFSKQFNGSSRWNQATWELDVGGSYDMRLHKL